MTIDIAEWARLFTLRSDVLTFEDSAVSRKSTRWRLVPALGAGGVGGVGVMVTARNMISPLQGRGLPRAGQGWPLKTVGPTISALQVFIS